MTEDLSLAIELTRGLSADSPVRAIRQEVFVVEQGITDEFEEQDDCSLHALVRVEGQPVACGRAFCEDVESGLWHLGRFAVRKPFRRQGYGSRVLEVLEREARTHGARAFTLDAQLHAAPFYQAHGYQAVTEVYELVGIPHVTMQKSAK